LDSVTNDCGQGNREMKYIIRGNVTTELELELEADSETEAAKIASKIRLSDWTTIQDNYFNIMGVERV